MIGIATYTAVAVVLAALAGPPQACDYFKIKVVDDQTGRGVPLVALETTNNVRYYTDSSGLVAFYEPGLMDQTVHFRVSSHGYEYPKDGFGIAGVRLKTVPGGSAEIRIKRINIAERLYRITGGGIYRDSVLLGEKPPTTQPVLQAQVHGCDSIQSVIYKGRLYWFWGDTNWTQYPLGNFNMSGAWLELPGRGGHDPEIGVNLHYFIREDGFARAMAPIPGRGPTWLSAPIVLQDQGRDRLLMTYSKIKDASMETYERGLAGWNDQKEIFEKVVAWELKHPAVPGGCAFRARGADGEHIYFCSPFPLTRVRPEPKLFENLDNFEMFTCLREGMTVDDARSRDDALDRDARGRVRYSWKHRTPVLNQKDQLELVKSGRMKSHDGLIQLCDVETGKIVLAHGGSVFWNSYRKAWVAIFVEIFGTSVLGELWYAEAPTPLGPWVACRKIVTHHNYTFYNPLHHPYFDKEGGRIIFFEGTYCNTFSGNPYQTPRYDYNQMMYKLDLSDPRLHAAPSSSTTRPAMETELLREAKLEQITP